MKVHICHSSQIIFNNLFLLKNKTNKQNTTKHQLRMIEGTKIVSLKFLENQWMIQEIVLSLKGKEAVRESTASPNHGKI